MLKWGPGGPASWKNYQASTYFLYNTIISTAIKENQYRSIKINENQSISKQSDIKMGN